MFLSHIALALELISLGLAAILIAKSGRDCHCHTTYVDKTPGDHPTERTHKRCQCGFLKGVGYFILVLSFLGLICTSITYGCYISKFGWKGMMYRDYLQQPVTPRENIRLEENNTAEPLVPDTTNP